MLEKPDIQEERIRAALNEIYRLDAVRAVFLPVGYDLNTAAYRAERTDGAAYFLKLRKRTPDKKSCDEYSAAIPRLLHEQGVRAVMAPLETEDGQAWGRMDEYTTLLYPFVEGENGYEADLSDRNWIELGAALGALHATAVPPALAAQIPRERYLPEGREAVRAFQAEVETRTYQDDTAARLAAFMRDCRVEITRLIERAEALGNALSSRGADRVLCHGDLHPGNLLVARDGNVYLVDWDDLVFAPKERDLMFLGAGMDGGRSTGREIGLFYQGYGEVEIDRTALAYFRFERIIQDIAAFCRQILATEEGGEDREQSYRYFIGQFEPGHEVERAFQTERSNEPGFSAFE